MLDMLDTPTPDKLYTWKHAWGMHAQRKTERKYAWGKYAWGTPIGNTHGTPHCTLDRNILREYFKESCNIV